MYIYSIKDHCLSKDSKVGVQYDLKDFNCYSGHGEGLNNIDFIKIHDMGPICPGDYIFGTSRYSTKSGPITISIIPKQETETFNRSGFELHGDEKEHIGEHLASHGCIIAGPVTRASVARDMDKDLRVVTSFKDYELLQKASLPTT